MMRRWLAAGCVVVAAAATLTAFAAEKKAAKKAAPKKIEHLSCMLGTDDRQARVAVEIIGGRIQSFAYYSKKTPRTCSVHLQRDDAYSKWSDEGRFTKVTTENGDFLFENRPKDLHFLFREVDRMAFCGMDIGKINGSVTLIRGKKECLVDRLMEAHEEPSS